MDSLWFYVIRVGGVVVAVLFGWFGIKSIIKYRRTNQRLADSQAWNEGEAEILSSDMEKRVQEDEESRSVSYIPHVRYRYFVDRQEYQGDQIGFGDLQFSIDRKAEAILEAYPVGGKVRVFINPLNPQEAVLDRQIFRPSASLASGIIMVLAMFLIIYLIFF